MRRCISKSTEKLIAPGMPKDAVVRVLDECAHAIAKLQDDLYRVQYIAELLAKTLYHGKIKQ